MKRVNDPSKTVEELIDRLDRIREELMIVQQAIEKLDPSKSRKTLSQAEATSRGTPKIPTRQM